MGQKVLVIGYGSIGIKHCKVLKTIPFIDEIKVITKQKKVPYEKISFKKRDILKYNPDYIIICNQTFIHFKSLKTLNEILKNKKILIEKPIFDQIYSLKIKNKIYVNYLLRVHPLIEELKKIIDRKNFNFVNIICFSNVEKWRKNIKFSKSYSSSKEQGGGVTKELSHELDLMNYIFKVKKIVFSMRKKISNLKGNADDTSVLIGKTKNKFILISLNYSAKLNYRKIIVSGENYSLELDLKKNTYKYFNDKKIQSKKIKINFFNLLKKMHLSILKSKNLEKICNFKQAIQVVKYFNA